LEKYQEDSDRGKEQTGIAGVILAAILAWLSWQIWHYANGSGGLGVILYVLGFLGLWAWRYAFSYTYILTGSTVEVVTRGWGLERKLVVEVNSIESFATRYHKKFFRQTGIKKYLYRYSSADPRPTRILVFTREGKMHGLLFKASDEFIGRLDERLPGRLLDMKEMKAGEQ
jgi:hypothetical protein